MFGWERLTRIVSMDSNCVLPSKVYSRLNEGLRSALGRLGTTVWSNVMMDFVNSAGGATEPDRNDFMLANVFVLCLMVFLVSDCS